MSIKGNKENGEDILKKMSTEELESIIKMDTPFLNDETDVKYILKVLEVIEKREKDNPSGEYNTEVDESWESFKNNYKDLDIKNESLLSANYSSCKEVKKSKKLVRVASILIALVGIICSVSVASNIFNYNIWGAVANLGESTFGFVTTFSNLQDEKELHNKLIEYNITNVKVPRKIPSNYNCTGVDVIESPKKTIFSANYVMDDRELTITVNYLNDITSLTYEKNAEVEVYNKKDIEYYIMHNYEQLQAVWLYENCEYIIKGDISETELKKMIDSILGG